MSLRITLCSCEFVWNDVIPQVLVQRCRLPVVGVSVGVHPLSVRGSPDHSLRLLFELSVLVLVSVVAVSMSVVLIVGLLSVVSRLVVEMIQLYRLRLVLTAHFVYMVLHPVTTPSSHDHCQVVRMRTEGLPVRAQPRQPLDHVYCFLRDCGHRFVQVSTKKGSSIQ